MNEETKEEIDCKFEKLSNRLISTDSVSYDMLLEIIDLLNKNTNG